MKKTVLDIETESLNPKKVHCVCTEDLDTDEKLCFTDPKEFNKYVGDSDRLIVHNGISFDLPVLSRLWFTPITLSKVRDTLVLSRFLKSSREGGHSLEAWGERLGIPKNTYNDFSECTLELIERCHTDVTITKLLYKHLIKQLKVADPYLMECEVEHLISTMCRDGMAFNTFIAHQLINEITDKITPLEESFEIEFTPKVKLVKEIPLKYSKQGLPLKCRIKAINEYCDDVSGDFSLIEYVKFNAKSPKQVVERMDEAGWKPVEFTKTGQPQVSEKNLDTLPEDAPPSAQKFKEYLTLSSRVSTLNTWLAACDEDSIAHPTVFALGAGTHRMTHSDPNQANVPSVDAVYGKEFRSLFVTRGKGRKIVGTDASGLELRMLAHFLNNPEFTEQVLTGDPHTYNQQMIGLSERRVAKTWLYAFIYGAADAKLGRIIGGSTKDGKDSRAKALERITGLKELVSTTEAEFKRTKGVYLIDRRKVYPTSPHAALNYKLQGSGAVLCKKWATLNRRKILANNLDAILFAFPHDELQYDVREEHVDKFVTFPDQCIQDAGKYFNLNLPFNAEVKVGNNWSETH